SYPGYPLRLGSSGDKVLTLQIQLDRIAINYPAIPLVFADGVFGPNTQASVRAFQRIAGLSADGIVGRATWYAVNLYYVAVKKLAELASEGELPVYNDFRFPGTLRRGSRGTSVQTVQFFLNTLAAYNPEIPAIRIDGVYGEATVRAVGAAQNFFGIPADGIVGPQTWENLVDAYRGAQNVPVPPEGINTRPYPGSLVRRGQSGTNVRYVQEVLNRIREVFVQIPRLSADGVFGANTESAVRTFQRLFGLSADGIVGERTWNRLNEVLVATLGCLFESSTAAYTRPYPGSLVRRGQSNTNVRYVQTALSAIRRVLPTIPALSVDGVFGAGTEASVIAFQRIFGLVDDGIVGPKTWEEINFLYVATTDGCLTREVRAAVTEEIESRAVSAAPALPQEKKQKNLRLGSFGAEVLTEKRRLAKKMSLPLSTLGDNMLFGLSTRRAVETFQIMHDLTPTGELDEETRERLSEE
ncbi:MAG: peptidoglycan-binding protein, partial [Clostridia bacterium]|nr:peptidoglycan-binding protein [Clostridia bacterium]